MSILFSFLSIIFITSTIFAEGQISPLVFPPPRQIQILPSWTLQLPLKIEAQPSLNLPAQLLQRELNKLLGESAISSKGKTTISLRLDPKNLLREEEYAVEMGANKITLLSNDLQGAFWAVHSLIQILSSPSVTRTSKGWRIPGLKLRDYPEDNFRAFMVQGAWAEDIEALRMMIELLARFKVRYVALEFGPQVLLDFDPSIARGARLSKSQAKELVDYARSLGLEPIGYLNMLGHLERAYQKFPYTEQGGIMIQNEGVYKGFIFPILKEMLEIYGPIKWFHCGMDEAWELFSWFSRNGYDSAELLAEHIRRINDFLKEKGIKLVIWHDMFFSPELEKEIGAPIGPANGGPPQNTARALELIPKDVILDYWFYDPLDAYPALDWLKNKGFQVWASPWQTPFSLIRYAQARDVPTLGTIWADPPGCFSSHSLAPVIALYAWASWNPASAPPGHNPERDIASQALLITQQALWRRRELNFPTSIALLLRPEGIITLAIPRDLGKAPEQHYGVPFNFSPLFAVNRLKGVEKAMEKLDDAESVLLPRGLKLKLDGINRSRGTDELILYTAPLSSSETNIYGVEVAVSSKGEVTDISDYGSGNMMIPPGGAVLSAHIGPKSEKANALRSLKQGDRIAFLDREGNLLGGLTLAIPKLELPDGRRLAIDGINKPRGEDELILYTSAFSGNRTGTNQWGVEVIVRRGEVREVRDWIGDSDIPADGYVLSAHRGTTSAKANALANLKVGDKVKVILLTESGELGLEEAIEKGSWKREIGKRCQRLFFVTATELSVPLGTLLGVFKVTFLDGSEEAIPIRYGVEALPLQGGELPIPEVGKSWIILREGEVQRFMVREWVNPRQDIPLQSLSFTPTVQGLEAGVWIMGITVGISR